MHISRTAKIVSFTSWNREDHETLTVVIDVGTVQLYLNTAFNDCAVQLSKIEAHELSDDLARLFASPGRLVESNAIPDARTNRAEGDLVVQVNTTNRGEPYEDGVIVEIGQRNEYPAAFSIELALSTAWKLSQALKG